jgi:hypothetical protein
LLQQIWVHFVLTTTLETKEMYSLQSLVERLAHLGANRAPLWEAWGTSATHKIFLTICRLLGLFLYRAFFNVIFFHI